MSKSKILNIILYYILALGFSLVLNLYTPAWFAQPLYKGLNVLSYGLGPMFAVGIIYLLSKNLNLEFVSYSFFGSAKWYKAILVFITPIIVSVAFNDNPVKQFLILLSIMLYCLFEEIGWRGWLLPQLKGQKEWFKILVVWVLWTFWHFTFQPVNLAFVGFLLAGTLGINLATTKTKSILVAASMHAIPNLIEFNPYQMLIIVPIWVLVFYSWDR
jgi:uncharacterized protein